MTLSDRTTLLQYFEQHNLGNQSEHSLHFFFPVVSLKCTGKREVGILLAPDEI